MWTKREYIIRSLLLPFPLLNEDFIDKLSLTALAVPVNNAEGVKLKA